MNADTDRADAPRISKTIEGLRLHNARHQAAGHGFAFTVKLDRAEQCLRTAVTLNSGDVNIKVALGVALGHLDRPDDAVEVLRAAVSQDQGNPWAHRNLGAMLMKVGQPTEALPHFQAATRLLPKDQIAWIGLADANRQVGKAKNAADAYRVAVEINPHSDLAEQARAGSNALSQSGFDKVRQVTPRQDAVH